MFPFEADLQILKSHVIETQILHFVNIEHSPYPILTRIIDEGINYKTLLGKTKALLFIVSYVVSTSSLY